MPPAAREGRDEYAGGGEDTRENTPRWRREAPPLPPEPFRKSDEDAAFERMWLCVGPPPGQREVELSLALDDMPRDELIDLLRRSRGELRTLRHRVGGLEGAEDWRAVGDWWD